MEEKRTITEKSSEVIRFDSRLWAEIKDYVLKNYQTFSIKIVQEDREERFDKFDMAYDYICDNADGMKSIAVDANADNEWLSIVFTNRGKNHTVFIEAECPDVYRAHDVRQLMIKLTKDFNVNYYGLYFIPMILVILLLRQLIDYFADMFSWGAWHFFTIKVINYLAFIAIIFFINKHMKKTDKIRFLIEDSRTQEFKARRRKACIIAAVSFVLAMTIAYYFYWIKGIPL